MRHHNIIIKRQDKYNILWNKQLNRGKWTPKQINEQANYLDLDCVRDINKMIQLWVGYIAKQLIDNKINIVDTAGYIERTFVGEVKLWFLNLEDEAIKTHADIILGLNWLESLKPYKIEPTHITITYGRKTRIIKRII